MSAEQSENKTLRILVVDDEPILVELMQRILIRGGYEVEAVECPMRVLEILSENPDSFDVLITDQTMPEMNGDQLAAEARKVAPNIRMILTTGHGEQADSTAFQYLLAKPFTPTDLCSAIDAVMREEPANQQPSID